MSKKVVLAYSGGLDTSIIIPWLNENYGMDVIAMIADVGQGEDLDAVVAKAYATGAKKAVVLDLRDEFVRDYVYPTVRAGAIYEHKYLLGTSIARPVIAKHQVEVALKEGAEAVAHGCTGKGNDQVRFEHAYQALAPDLKVIAPWREWTLKSREDCLDYAEAHGIPVAASREKIHSRDRNLWHISHEGGELENAGNAPLPTTWVMTRSPQEAPDREEVVEIGFVEGRPVSVDGMALEPVQIVELLNEIGARNAIGRIDLVENRFVGIKSRGLYETPGGTLITIGPSRTRSTDAGPRSDALQAAGGSQVRRAGVFRPVVYALARSPGRLCGQHAEAGYRHGEAFSVQGQHRCGWTAVAVLALLRRFVFVHHGRQLRPERCQGLHPDSGAARPHPCAFAAEERGAPVKMWSGRFREPLDHNFEQWQRSLAFDWQLLPQEVAASKAHARTIAAAGILTAKRSWKRLRERWTRFATSTRSVRPAIFTAAREAEDIHHFVELELVARIGDLGFKLHTGRSRNEQIATDLRLFVRENCASIAGRLADWVRALTAQAHAAGDAVMPAYTHLQRAEPVLVAHWLQAYGEMLLRDMTRLGDLSRRLNYCPLGSGAVAGATLKLDRTIAARELGFSMGQPPIAWTRPATAISHLSFCRRLRWLLCMPAGLRKRSRFMPRRSSDLSSCPKHFRRDRARCRKRRTLI